MNRRDFLKTSAVGGAALAVAPSLMSWVPSHNWEGYDFGSGPEPHDRLYQGPFPQYAPEDFFGGEVVQYTTAGRQQISCFGQGLTAYISGDLGAPSVPGKTVEQAIDELFRFPLATKVYIRPNWRHLQKRAGRLEPDDYWRITLEKARQYGKQVGFRVMMNNPDMLENALPDFMLRKLKMHRLKGQWKGDPSVARYQHDHLQPEYWDPYFLSCFEELHSLLADELVDTDLIEYVDTSMYGFWGEGHTWPYDGHPFPNQQTAEQTFLRMFEVQNRLWKHIPLLTNTQPDYSRVGNSAVVDRTIRTGNWLRTDTIFIENEQIEALANRPSWTAAAVECGLTDGREETMRRDAAGIPYNEAIIGHVKDVGACYFSLWNWHQIDADNLWRYYRQYPDGLDDIARTIGFRVRPSWIWHSESRDGAAQLIIGMVNDGIADVPGILRLTLFTEEGDLCLSGCLDAGYPHTRGVRQCLFTLPAGVDALSGRLRLRAELEVKGKCHPVPFTCAQPLNADGSLTIRRNLRD